MAVSVWSVAKLLLTVPFFSLKSSKVISDGDRRHAAVEAGEWDREGPRPGAVVDELSGRAPSRHCSHEDRWEVPEL